MNETGAGSARKALEQHHCLPGCHVAGQEGNCRSRGRISAVNISKQSQSVQPGLVAGPETSGHTNFLAARPRKDEWAGMANVPAPDTPGGVVKWLQFRVSGSTFECPNMYQLVKPIGKGGEMMDVKTSGARVEALQAGETLPRGSRCRRRRRHCYCPGPPTRACIHRVLHCGGALLPP